MNSMMIKYDKTMEALPAGQGKEGYYPGLEITGNSIPELMDMKIGDTCEICIKVKIRSLRSDDRGDFANVDVISGEYKEDSGEDE